MRGVDFVEELMSVQTDDRIIEIGFGTGKLIYKMARQIDNGLIEGVDFSRTMISIAQKRNKKNIAKGKVKICEGDFDKMPYEKETFSKVTQIDLKSGGQIKIGLYDSDGFPEVGKPVDGADIAVAEQSVVYIFKHVPVGRYAIAVFQDKNNDNILNKNIFGVPKEPYGFSKNKYGMFGPPDFKEVCFDVAEDESVSFTISLE